VAAQDTATEAKGEKLPAERRAAGSEIAMAIDLGWRVAALFALTPTTMKPPSEIDDDLLLNRRSLSAADRLELEVKAIAGVAARLGIPLEHADNARLVALAQHAGESAEGEQAFRDEIARRHTAFDKALWTANESGGKAYELGNFISDTWNRVARPRVKPDPRSELVEVFSPVRVERMKLLLDDLQARVDPVAAHAVTNHLAGWSKRLTGAPSDVPGAGLPLEEAVAKLEPVERQTIIWRQLLTGDKEPEAFIDHERRAEVRDELTKQLWKRYRPLAWLLPVVAAIGLGLGVEYAHNKEIARSLAGGFFTVAAALGLTRAAMISTVKRGVQSWGDLMWNRALAAVICRETSLLKELFPDDKPPRRFARLRGR
jgi:uncharacterized protein YfiM (DUF2279 family)